MLHEKLSNLLFESFCVAPFLLKNYFKSLCFFRDTEITVVWQISGIWGKVLNKSLLGKIVSTLP
jgi:hypothetical protein